MKLKKTLKGINKQGFNRTFMELKLAKQEGYGGIPAVLIVPLWNWNSLRVRRARTGTQVLIVPLWNWNDDGSKRDVLYIMF